MAATVESLDPRNDLKAALLVVAAPAARNEKIPVRLTEAELRDLGKAARENQTTPEIFLRALWNRWWIDHDRFPNHCSQVAGSNG